MDRPRLVAIIYGSDNGTNGDDGEYLKSGGRGAFIGCGNRCDYRCVSISTVVDGEAQWKQGTCQRSGGMRYCSFLFLPGSGGLGGIEGYYPFSVTLKIWLSTITLLLG